MSHLEKLRENHRYLKEQLDVTEILDYLYQENVFSHTDLDYCMAKASRTEKCEELLCVLKRKGKAGYDKFLQILDKCQPFIRMRLDGKDVSSLASISTVHLEKKVKNLEEKVAELARQNQKLLHMTLSKGKEDEDSGRESQLSVEENPESNPSRSMTLDARNRVCIFCGEIDADFDDEGLDVHYWKDCPMLTRCLDCKQVIEIEEMTNHLLSECNSKDLFTRCSRCLEAVRRIDYKLHLQKKVCSARGPNTTHCYMCNKNIRGGAEEWKIHLMGQNGCTENPRRLKALARQQGGKETEPKPSRSKIVINEGRSTPEHGGFRLSVRMIRVCIFCGESDRGFDENGLDMHYWKYCPMLVRCVGCKQVVEISEMTNHLLNDCDSKDSYTKCSRCLEAIRKEEYMLHTRKKDCSACGPDMSPCYLCHKNIRDGLDVWKAHLMGQNGCTQNPRRLPALARKKDS